MTNLINCKYYKEICIKMFINSDKEEDKLFNLCSNPITVVTQLGGVFFQCCVYNKENERDCPYRKRENKK